MLVSSPRCYVKSFVEIGSGDEDFLRGIYRRGGYFVHVTQMPAINLCSSNPRWLHIKLGFDWPRGFGGEAL